MQNAVFLVQDHLSGWIGDNKATDLDNYYAAVWEVRIGNSSVYSDNPKCPGGPSLKATYDDYTDESAVADKLITPNPSFGFKKFCNMSGRYTFFVAAKVPKKELSLCSVGVFGPSYIRKESI